MLLRLRRFTDKGSAKRARLPLSLELLRKIAIDKDSTELHRLLVECERKCDFARNWSDKRIAHSDYDYRMGRVALQGASRQKVTDAIDSIAAVIKWIGSELLDTHYVTHPIADLRDESAFLRALFEGKAVIDKKPELVSRLMKAGKYDQAQRVHEYPDWLARLPDQHD